MPYFINKKITTCATIPIFFYRSKDALMRVWEKMKSEAKMYNSRNRSCTTGTGGGPSTTKIDPILEQVCDLMGRGCSGIADVSDSDSVIIPIKSNVTDLEIINEESQTIILDAELVTVSTRRYIILHNLFMMP